MWGAGVILFTVLFNSFKNYDLQKYKDATERCDQICNIISEQEVSQELKDFLASLLS